MKTLLVIPALLLISACAYAQVQDKEAAKKQIEAIKQQIKDYEKRGLVWNYDRFRDETMIRTKTTGVQVIPFQIVINAAIYFKGQVGPDSSTDPMFIISIAADGWQQIKSDRQVRILFEGGDIITLGTASYDSHVGQRNESLTNERLTVAIKQSDLARMAQSKLVRAQVGRLELVIQEKQLKTLQPLVDLLTVSTPSK